MIEAEFFNIFIMGWLCIALITFVLLFFRTAQYGRHMKSDGGQTINGSWGWVFMEVISLLLMIFLFFTGNRHGNTVALVFLGMWVFHYAYRSFLFPLKRRGGENRMPVVILLSAGFFNLINAYINGRYLFFISDLHMERWLLDIRFIAGSFLFVLGFIINVHSDKILINLRQSNTQGYSIPYGGLYRWVSCPNYLGEIVEWVGWAIATWSLPGAVFALWTMANLLPRSRSHHRWYKSLFDDYPEQRRALIPFLF